MRWWAAVIVLFSLTPNAAAHTKGITCAIKAHDKEHKLIQVQCPPKDFYAPLRVNLEFGVREDLPTPWLGSICKFEAVKVVEQDGNGNKTGERREMWLEYKDTAGALRRVELKNVERILFDEEK